MAKTLQEFKKEFEAVKKEVASNVDEMESLEHNLDQHRELLVEGFKALGIRIHELRDAGTVGTKIEDFQADKEVAVMVKELANRREMAKKDALRGQEIHTKAYKPILARMKALQDGLTAEIADRKKKFSSKTLGINQSVKEMEPLLAEVTKYVKGGNKDYEAIVNYGGGYPPAQFERLYDKLLDEELKKSKAVALSDQQQMLMKQALNVKNMQSSFNKAKLQYAEVVKQAKLAKDAHQARNVQGLSDAKKASDAAMTAIETLVEPYEKAMKDSKIVDIVQHSPEKGAIEKGVAALFEVKSRAKEQVEEIQARRFA